MNLNFWLIQAFNGISYGALLFLVGSGLSLIFGVMRIVNLAHGSYFMLGGYVALTVIWTTGSWLLAIPVAATAIALVGLVMERVFLRRLGFDPLRQVLLTVGFAFLFQQAALYDSITVEENVAFPLKRHSKEPENKQKERVAELLELVGMEQHGHKLPSQISGGMQKRVGLARALALEPDIMLFDEPTAGLDPITAAEIDDLIVQTQKKRKVTAIVVTHDIRGAKTFADRLLLLRDGRIVASGSFAELQQSHDEFVTQFVGAGHEG